MLHLMSPEPLFRRVACAGGSALLFRPLAESVGETAYSSVLKALGLEIMPPEQRIKRLLEIPITEIVSKISPEIPLRPIIDGEIITSDVTFAGWRDTAHLPGRAWCESILIGDCQFDVSVRACLRRPVLIPGAGKHPLVLTIPNGQFSENIRDVCGDDVARSRYNRSTAITHLRYQ